MALGSDAPKGGSVTQVWQLGTEPKVAFTSPASYGGGVFALSPGGTRLLTSGTTAPEAFDLSTGKSLGVPTGTARFSHAFFRDERVAVWVQRSHGFDKPQKRKVYVWDVVKNADAGAFEVPDDRFEVAYPARDGAELWLFQSAKRFEVECYDIGAKKLTRTIRPVSDEPGKPLTSAGIWQAVTPDGAAFASTCSRLRVYDGKTGQAVGQLPADVYGLPDGLAPGGTRYLARTAGDKAKGGTVGPNDLILVDWRSGLRLAVLAVSFEGDADPRAGVSADGKTAVVASKRGEVLVFDLSALK